MKAKPESLNSLQGISEDIQQALEDNKAGQKLLSEALKETLDKLATSPATASKSGRTTIRTKIDSGACEPVIPPTVALD